MRVAAFLVLATLGRNALSAEPDSGQGYSWNLPKGFPKPHVPADNPMTAAKVELGRHLFYDTRMSVSRKASCANCHQQQFAFTDGRATSVGATGQLHSRSAMSLVNVAYSAALTWSNSRMKELEEQALVPMFGDHPIELGLQEGDGFLGMLHSDPKYQNLFARAFPGDADRFTVRNVAKALAAFERSIISARSPYDRYHYGATMVRCPIPPSAAKFCSSTSTFRVSVATADSISATRLFLKTTLAERSSFTIQGFTILPACSPIRLRTWARMSTPGSPQMLESSKPRRCVTSRSRRPICTTAALRRLKAFWITMPQGAGR
jgi:hypothetical protein